MIFHISVDKIYYDNFYEYYSTVTEIIFLLKDFGESVYEEWVSN